MPIMKEETENMHPSQAFWFSFADEEIPSESMLKHSKLLHRISNLIQAGKAFMRSTGYDSVHVSSYPEYGDMSECTERNFYFQLADLCFV